MIQRVENEIACLKRLNPVAIVTGSYVDSRHLPRAQYSPCLGRTIHLASGLLRPRRGHDRPHHADCDQGRCRLVHPAIHQLLDQARFPEFGKPCREAFRGYGLRLDLRVLARRHHAGRGASEFPESSYLPTITSLVPSFRKKSSRFPLKSKTFRGTSRSSTSPWEVLAHARSSQESSRASQEGRTASSLP